MVGVGGLTRELDQELVGISTAFVGEGNLTALIVASVPLRGRRVDGQGISLKVGGAGAAANGVGGGEAEESKDGEELHGKDHGKI